MTFPVTQGARERSFFEAWMDLLVDPVTNMAFGIDGSGRGNDKYASIEVITTTSDGSPTG